MNSSPSLSAKSGTRAGSIAASPVFWLIAISAVLLVLLTLPIVIPIGPMYWDSYIYFDAAQRIWNGQVPDVDFLTPVGPLGYYIFAWGLELFPRAQGLLLAQWSVLVVAVPLMGVVLADLAPRNRALAFALLVPFFVFGVSPINVETFHSYPGFDGVGIYNRQMVLLLYVLMSGLMFLPNGRKLAVFCALTMLSLFLTKITGFLVGGLFGIAALLAGRISLRNVVLAAIIAVLCLLALELNHHMITGYLGDIRQLVAANTGALLPRFLTAISIHLATILAAGVLFLALVWIDVARDTGKQRFFDRSPVWVAVVLAGGIILETQNTGSQEFIFLWPVLLMIWGRVRRMDNKAWLVFAALAAFCVVPLFTAVASKALRAAIIAPTYVQLPATELKNMEQVSTKPVIMERVLLLEDHYARYDDTYKALAEQGQMPSWQLYSEHDFQMFWLLSVDKVIKDLKAYEAANGIHLQSLMTLDFTDPLPWLLDRKPTPYIQIAADPDRTLPPITDRIKASVAATDGVLRPHCPETWARLALRKFYAEPLQGRTVVKLNPCWDLLLRPGILPQKAG
ncbi:MAG: hypothetical protein BGP07_18195 [Rhizobiales bacterium 63-22]|nr:MAG: hypothetical protein BGP07_18195 [Rhizobiales bacterium 63-22]